MEEWLVMLAAVAVVCVICPPVLGFVIGIATVMALMLVFTKLLGG